MRRIAMMVAGITGAALLGAGAAEAQSAKGQCITKGARATAGSADSAKWYVMETMVQSVSWGLWPGFLAANQSHTANYKVAGYRITGERYQCQPAGGQVTCRGRATFCKTG
jgi:hypothetical protein